MNNRPVRVLVVDDDEDDYILTRDLLQEIDGARFEVEWVGTYEAAMDAVAHNQHDVYLVDYRLGEHNGLELLREVTANGCSSPLILLTGQGNQEIDVEAMKAGAVDFLEKSQLNTPLLERSIRYAIERKRTEEALRESEERLQAILDNSTAAIYVKDTEGRYILNNRRSLTLLNLGAEEAKGKTDYDIFPAEIAEAFRVNDQKVLVAGTPLELEEVIAHDDGLHTYLSVKFPLYDAGIPYAVCGISTDITHRKRAEQKIREQAALLDIATDAILVRDLNNQILFWNKGAERLYGWKAQEALGKNANELLYKEISQELKAAQKTVALVGEWYGELHKVTKHGKEIIVESRWTLVRDQEGKPKSILTVNTDITEKKQLEAQFLRAQRMESIGTLASGIAHDLNNVLTPILISAQLLQLKTTPDERSQRLLKTLETNAKRGGALVKQVLSFSRGLEGERTILQVRHLISEIQHIVKETFPKSIDFYTDIAPELWSMSGDATQLHQVFMNLAVNARDAMPNGGTLSIEAENFFIDENYARMHLDASVGPYIVFTVGDTGTGIPPEIVDRIFEPFFTTKELGKGTGLGLATVIGIIKSHGGFVTVYSKLRQGTQFKVYLPAVEGSQTQQAPDIELPTGNGELVLVVDDEDAIREVTETSLETYKYKVVTASDGIDAIAMYVQHKNEISVVLMDMMMPVMDGATAILTLQKIKPQVKIIAVSGQTSNQATTGTGVKAFLAKPYTTQELLRTIKEVLTH